MEPAPPGPDSRVMNGVRSVLVTGASGFVGSALVDLLDRGPRPVTRALRSMSALPHPHDAIVGDIGAETRWGGLLENVDCVVHLAARTHVLGEHGTGALPAFRAINVKGTVRLAQHAAAAGVRRFVFLSSVKVNGEQTGDEPFSEADAPQPQDAYGISKLEAEDALRNIEAATGLETVILRPPLIYGPGVKGNFLRLLRLISHRTPLPLASIKNRRSLIGIENLVDAIIAGIENPVAAGKTYLVSDGEDPSTPQLILKLAQALGVQPNLLPCPVALLDLGAAILGKRDEAMRLTCSLQVNSSRIREELGWKPRYSLNQGLNSTAQWYHQRKNKGSP